LSIDKRYKTSYLCIIISEAITLSKTNVPRGTYNSCKVELLKFKLFSCFVLALTKNCVDFKVTTNDSHGGVAVFLWVNNVIVFTVSPILKFPYVSHTDQNGFSSLDIDKYTTCERLAKYIAFTGTSLGFDNLGC